MDAFGRTVTTVAGVIAFGFGGAGIVVVNQIMHDYQLTPQAANIIPFYGLVSFFLVIGGLALLVLAARAPGIPSDPA